MRSTDLYVAALLLVWYAGAAWASPTMIRLGYTSCAPCHLSPQGGGLLTDYGKGIDLAQSLLARDYAPPSDASQRRFIQDFRVLLAAYRNVDLTRDEAAASPDVRLWYRAARKLGANHRLSSTVGINFWSDPTTISAHADPKLVVIKALWEYRIAEGVELAVGRDVRPSGLEMTDYQDFLRTSTEPGATTSSFTQAKLFWWTKRVHLTPFVFGPGGGENRRFRQYGAGVLGGIEGWHQRAVIGASARMSRTESYTRKSIGAYARLGFGRWGILTEQELVDRSEPTSDAQAVQQYMEDTQVFFAVYEWLVTSMTMQYGSFDGFTSGYVGRLAPAAQIRVSDKVTIVVGERNLFVDPRRTRTRTYSIQLFLKTVD